MREDPVRLASGVSSLAFRPMFPEWSAELDITYLSGNLSLDSLVTLVEAAGLTVGVGDWRNEKNGDFGAFTVDDRKMK
jgi:hypothetical protein